MIKLYNATNGREWANNDNWLSDRPLYEWFGLKVNIDGRVTEINLSGKGLDGTLPPELGELDQLQRLFIENSHLSGVIPREFGRLTQLEYLFLRGNDLTGPIPHELGLLPHLRSLDLAYNSLSGGIPPSFMRSESLESIDLGYNALTGSIPGEFALRSQIGYLRLSGNQLNSEIPRQIERARNLVELALSDNQLIGEIPPGIAKLQMLVRFSVSNNQMTGQIPNWFARLQRLKRLNIDSNRFTGTVPEGLADLELHQLSIAGNHFSGCIPSNLQDVPFNNLDFSNIPVCGEPERAQLVVPQYAKLAIGDAANSAETLAAQLGAQWLNDFTEGIGWPAPETAITVYVDRKQGLLMSYADYVNECDLQCALLAIDRRYQHPPELRGAAFVQLYGSHGNELELLADRTARETFNAMQVELADRLNTQGLQRDPRWWTYGLSTFVGSLAIADGTGQSRDERRREIAEVAVRSYFNPLWDLEQDGSWGYSHHQGAMAIDLLASQVGLRKLTEFYTERTDGEDWRQTFQRVFNISVPDFYELFNQHHRNGYPLRPLPTEGTTQWP